MHKTNILAVGLVVLALTACHKRSRIEVEGEGVKNPNAAEGRPRDPEPIPVSNPDWKDGHPTALVGHWASSLFQDQRCTAFYSFLDSATLELNLICFNTEKKQVERELRTFAVAQFPGSPQLRLRPVSSSCEAPDGRDLQGNGSVFLYAVDAQGAGGQQPQLAIWEPNVGKTPLSLSKSDGLMAEGFPGKTGTYLGLPVVTGCFKDGIVSQFIAATTP